MRNAAYMIRGLLLCLGLCGALTACSSFSPQEPPIADTTFVDMLTELHLAQVRVDIYDDTTLVALRDSVFSHYDVSQTQFERALKYYSERPSTYISIHEAVQDSLEAGRKRLMQ
jgi:hypothetical protein